MSDDPRPPVWIGHVHMQTDRVEASNAFLVELGLRPIASGDGFAVLELRGGTHLVLRQVDAAPEGDAPFDLMVEDLEATHAELARKGLAPSPIEPGRIHSSFRVRDPSGQTVKFNSTHVAGPV